jgi:hypothetical protein
LKMEQAFQLDTVREIRYFVYLPWIGKERRNFLIPRLTFGMSTKNEKFESLLLGDLDLKFLSRQMFFVWDDNYKLGCLTSNLCTMKILNDTIQWIILCSILCMVLSSSSHPW